MYPLYLVYVQTCFSHFDLSSVILGEKIAKPTHSFPRIPLLSLAISQCTVAKSFKKE